MTIYITNWNETNHYKHMWIGDGYLSSIILYADSQYSDFDSTLYFSNLYGGNFL